MWRRLRVVGDRWNWSSDGVSGVGRGGHLSKKPVCQLVCLLFGGVHVSSNEPSLATKKSLKRLTRSTRHVTLVTRQWNE